MASQHSIAPQFPKKLEMLFRPARYKVLYGGRGGAKSWGVARALLILGAQKCIRVLCAREFQNSIKDSVLKLFEDQIEDLRLGDFYDAQATQIIGANGTEFGFEGIRQNVRRIRSYEGADYVWVEEAEKVTKASWNVLIPTIRKDGSEIWMTFNPEFEDDETYERFVLHPPRRALIQEINWRDNPWFPKELEEERLECKDRYPDSYDHIWEGKCLHWLEGAIYAKELRKAYAENRITDVAFDPALPVFTSWDLGHTDDTAIWWYQVALGEFHIIESYASSGGSLSEYATQILGVAAQIDLVDQDVVVKLGKDASEELQEMAEKIKYRREYRYERHYLPQDARAKTLAAKGKSIIQQLAAALTLQKMQIVPDIGVESGIQAARMMFNRCWFDKEGCDPGLKALRRYQRQLQEDAKSFKKIPHHNWTSHFADAFRMLAVSAQNVAKVENKKKEQDAIEADQSQQGRFILPSLETMWKEQPTKSARI